MTVEEPASDQKLIPAGKLMADFIDYELAVYYLPKPKSDPDQALDRLLREKFTDLQRLDDDKDDGNEMTVSPHLEENPGEQYPAPDVEFLRRYGRGVTQEQAQALQGTEAVFVIDFHYPGARVWKGLRQSSEMVEALARETGGLIWDETTREVFSPDAWNERRLAEWTDEVPEISSQTVIHAYQSGEFIRGITLGMEKVGLPDLVVNGFSWSTNRQVGHVINLVAQALAEGQAVGQAGSFDLDIRKIRNAAVREPQVDGLLENATGVALLTLKEAKRDEGDPDNRLIEIAFDRGTGPDRHARREQILIAAFGSEDFITEVKHDGAIEEASRRARLKLPGLRNAVNEGLAPGEYVLVKAPFATPEGQREWMWVEVAEWKGNDIRGLLQNEPAQIPDLHAGQMVTVSEEEVFDYIRRFPDGKTEGNETGKLMDPKRK